MPKKLKRKTFVVTWSPIMHDREHIQNSFVKASTALEAWRLFKKSNPKKYPIGCIETHLAPVI